MTEAEFAFLRRFLKDRSGLSLGPEKRYLAESRLQPVCRDNRLTGLSGLIAAVRGGDERLGRCVVEAMATGETLFFRDKPMVDALRGTILPGIMAAHDQRRRVRVWSAACSTGQEPYSIAMLFAETGQRAASCELKVLGTDISAAAIARAKAALYSQFEVQRGLPIKHLLRFFDQEGGGWRVRSEIRQRVEFRVANLLDDFQDLGTFDLIFCRNLLIYLDAQSRGALLERLARALGDGGILCLGAAETAFEQSHVLRPIEGVRGFYRSVEEPASKRSLAGAAA